MFENTDREATLYFSGERLQSITISKRSPIWKLPYNIEVGMSLDELVNINQKHFKVLGFEVDSGGTVLDWKGGKLDQSTVSIRLEVSKEVSDSEYIPFMSEFESDQTGTSKLGIRVKEIILYNPDSH